MDTAKFEKQVTDAGKTTRNVGWLAIVATVIWCTISVLEKNMFAAVVNLVLLGGLGVWMILAGKTATNQASARNFAGFRKTLMGLMWGIIIFAVLMLLAGGGPGVLLFLLIFWNLRAASASKKLETPLPPNNENPLASPAPVNPAPPQAPVDPEPVQPEPETQTLK